MSVHDSSLDHRNDLDALPSFELSFDFDDDERPRWVTVYSEQEDEIATHWLSIEVDYAIDLAKVA